MYIKKLYLLEFDKEKDYTYRWSKKFNNRNLSIYIYKKRVPNPYPPKIFVELNEYNKKLKIENYTILNKREPIIVFLEKFEDRVNSIIYRNILNTNNTGITHIYIPNELVPNKSKFVKLKIDWDYSELENTFEEYGIENFYYILHIENLESVFENGILARNYVNEHNRMDISDENVQRRRNEWHDYVPLFFADNTPMLYRVINEFNDNIILLEIDIDVIFNTESFVISNGNIASSYSEYIENPSCKEFIDFLKDNINWDILFSPSPVYYDWKRIRSAEVLIYEQVPKNFITGIHVQNEEIFENVSEIIDDYGLNIEIYNDLTEKGIVNE